MVGGTSAAAAGVSKHTPPETSAADAGHRAVGAVCSRRSLAWRTRGMRAMPGGFRLSARRCSSRCVHSRTLERWQRNDLCHLSTRLALPRRGARPGRWRGPC